MAQAKTAQIKKQSKVKTVTPADDLELAVPALGRNKKPLDLEDPELIPGSEEKIDEDTPTGEDGAEESTDDEAVMDEEEVNPFGDKWEG